MAWKLFSLKEKEAEESSERTGLFRKLKESLSKTGKHLVGRIRATLSQRGVDESLFSDLERILITSDIGVKATGKILAGVKEQARTLGITEADRLEALIKEDRKSTRLNSSHIQKSRMPSSA